LFLKTSLLWDLGKIEKIGSNTLTGTLAKCFELKDLPQLDAELRSGSISLFIDAFDEAEILSGWLGIELFLEDIVDHVQNVNKPYIVLFARSKTAENMQAWLELKAEENKISNYSILCQIEYFVESQAKEFIDQQLAEQQKHLSVYENLRNQIFNLFFKSLGLSDEDWKDPLARSFLGYAPVLQAIASLIRDGGTNLHALSQKLEVTDDTEGRLVCSVMESLLEREQSKVVIPLKNGNFKISDTAIWDNIFTPAEQLVRIYFLSTKSVKASDLKLLDIQLPPKLAETYENALRSFGGQHPFVGKNGGYAGVAFRDYTNAFLLSHPEYLKEDYKTLQTAFYEEDTVPSPLFSVVYSYLSKSVINDPNLISYIYESARARFGDETQLTISRDKDQYLVEISGVHSYRATSRFIRMQFSLDPSIKELVFNRQLENADIEFHGRIVLGKFDNAFKISDVVIKCDILTIQSKRLEVRNFNETIVEIRANQCEHAGLTIDCKPPDSLTISWNDGENYPWTNYYQAETHDEEFQDYKEEMLAFARILRHFRRHKKNDFARYIDLMENVVVGSNSMRKKLLQYLRDQTKIIYSEGNLYYLNIDTLESYNVNWESFRKGGMINKGILSFLRKFRNWNNSSQ
jgi:hypothetical protein